MMLLTRLKFILGFVVLAHQV